MDMIDINQVFEYVKWDQHGLLQTLLLFMIWWTSRGIRKDLHDYKQTTNTRLEINEERINDHEGRISTLETI